MLSSTIHFASWVSFRSYLKDCFNKSDYHFCKIGIAALMDEWMDESKSHFYDCCIAFIASLFETSKCAY